METHELITPTTDDQWDSYHRIRREELFEARGQLGVYNANHPDDRAPHNHPKLLVYSGDYVGVVRVDIDKGVAALRRVAIRADAQHRGHGRALLELVQRFARDAGCTKLISFVAPDAVAFYQGSGFDVEQEGAMGASSHGSVYMTKPLESSSAG
jgi:GNAT superfamily N-acetyltransferase